MQNHGSPGIGPTSQLPSNGVPGGPYRGAPRPGPPLRTDGRAITSMVLGIVSVVLSCLPGVGLVTGTIAIVLFAKFNGDFHRSGQQIGGRGMAIAGLVTGIVGAALGLFYLLYWLLVGTVISGLGTSLLRG